MKREPGVCRAPAFAKVYTTCRQSAFYANAAEQRFANCRSVARQDFLPQKQKKVLNSQRIKHFSLVYGVRKRWIAFLIDGFELLKKYMHQYCKLKMLCLAIVLLPLLTNIVRKNKVQVLTCTSTNINKINKLYLTNV